MIRKSKLKPDTPEIEQQEQNSSRDIILGLAKKPARGVYLLPNLFTTTSLFSGFYAVVAGMRGDFDNAAIAILISMILDTLDGRVARMTNTQSKFGAQYDSLADVVAFGMAPALVVFSWALQSLGNLGWVAAFVYVAAGALRLARFNVQLELVDKRYFIGLPIPAAAGVMAGMVWVGYDFGVQGRDYALLVALLVIIIGMLMVSNFSYYSFKEVDFKGKVPSITLLAIVLIFALVSLQPPVVLWLIFSLFALSGPVAYAWSLIKKIIV
jgi:CDP-diacylglycerol---serine O-phosphatidyltransferase